MCCCVPTFYILIFAVSKKLYFPLDFTTILSYNKYINKRYGGN